MPGGGVPVGARPPSSDRSCQPPVSPSEGVVFSGVCSRTPSAAFDVGFTDLASGRFGSDHAATPQIRGAGGLCRRGRTSSHGLPHQLPSLQGRESLGRGGGRRRCRRLRRWHGGLRLSDGELGTGPRPIHSSGAPSRDFPAPGGRRRKHGGTGPPLPGDPNRCGRPRGAWLLQRPDLLKFGGAKGNRTPDLLDANETRYQLRYSPLYR